MVDTDWIGFGADGGQFSAFYAGCGSGVYGGSDAGGKSADDYFRSEERRVGKEC